MIFFNEVMTVQSIDNLSSKLIVAQKLTPRKQFVFAKKTRSEILVGKLKHPATTVHILLSPLFFCILHVK